MKILLVNHFPLEGSGSGIYTKNIARRLYNKGQQVKVITVNSELPDGIDFPVRVIIQNQFPCFTTHPRSSNTFYNLTQQEMNEYLYKFITMIREEAEGFKPDLIHCQHIWVAPYAAWLTQIPYIITAHGTDIMGFKRDRRYRNVAFKGAEGAARIITISKQVHRDVKELFNLPEEKLKLVQNGFDENVFKKMEVDREKILASLAGIDYRNVERVVNFVGKLTEFKGVDLLIKAAEIYERELPGVVTLISGDGHLKKRLLSLAEELKLKSIYFLGEQPQTTVARLYNLADVAVVPSRLEPFGLVAVEALACGTPVIASNAGGLPDFINSKVGRLFPMNDYRALADNIVASLKNEEKKTKGPSAEKYARENFSWERVTAELEQIYGDVITRG